MEPEVSLLHSHVLATYPYPEPARSSPCIQSQILKIYLNIILHLRLYLLSGLFSLGFLTKNPVYAAPLPHRCYIPRRSRLSRFYHPNND